MDNIEKQFKGLMIVRVSVLDPVGLCTTVGVGSAVWAWGT